MSWDCDITDCVKAGKSHRLVIGITDKPQEVNPFHRGGLIRDVILYTVPTSYVSRFQVETTFDERYADAILNVSASIEGGKGLLALTLISPSGNELALRPMTGEAGLDWNAQYDVPEPAKWDSEHPNLYTLAAGLTVDGILVEEVELKLGFRQIECRGNEVFINGQLLKLRGINRHDIHPISGRALTHEQWEEDVRLFKEANINFIRTSHYPPSPVFLDLCDRYGIYVEDEIAVSFLGYGTWHTENDPAYTSRYMDQFAELIERDRSRPSVIIWSLANESYWGDNLAMMNAYAKQADPGRLTIFSYPLTQFEDDLPTDIWSNHYDRWDRDLADLTDCFRRSHHDPEDRPVLHDESTHIPCYNKGEQQRDPGVKDFWGETIYRFWERLWETDGALGCAIWAGIDDIRIKDSRSFTHPWGILDGWRRPKPEYWHTRKGFSPIVLPSPPKTDGCATVLDIVNRFNHTNLNEVSIGWKLEGREGVLLGPDVPPRGAGRLVIPAAYRSGATLELTFTDPFGFRVDEAVLELDVPAMQSPKLSGTAPAINREGDSIVVAGPTFSIVFSAVTGQITQGYDNGELVLTGGPILNLTGLALGPWKLESIDAVEVSGAAQVILHGRYDKVAVTFVITVDADGLMETAYTITDMPYPSPREIAISGGITSHAGGYDEVGVSYVVAEGLDTLTWKRKGLWSVYPDWHIARLEGRTGKLNPGGANVLDAKPDWDWRMDEKDWPIFGKYDIGRWGTRDFTSMKPSILSASLENGQGKFSVLSDGSASVRMEVMLRPDHVVNDDDPGIRYSGSWARQATRYRTIGNSETWSAFGGDYCEYRFVGTGIAWYSSQDRICGMAKLYVDGELKKADIDLGLSRAGKTARGYRRLHKQLVYAVQDLSMGEHTLRIEVTGENAPGSNNSYVNIDHFVVLDGKEIGDTRFIVNNEFNYPEISWGDYTKPPIAVSSGYTGRAFTKLGR
ncbi:glycoside hydrolase family 2 TIM barrel-domain containing protein [Paenibacillus sp. HB172176]|uniref:glycoside hydrolase family 2 TIM barrel-domain containing protein n=1 Tax=Paenibacillus sp. HB172176 TaxID=2493690 RepID=UPI0014390EDE|nr:glycoside hydrolase family 2 TIM barrel-domain containing protein [Paenibacillus sp. HB172176]